MAKQVKFDAVKFDDTIGRLAKVYGRSKQAVADQQAGLILKDCVRFTPPYRGGEFKSESTGRFAIGKNAIVKQVDRIFRTIESLDVVHQQSRFSDELLKNLRMGFTEDATNMMHRATGKWFRFAAEPKREDHFKQIDKMGRSRKGQGVIFIGREEKLKRYYNKLFKRVMRGVGGWFNACKVLSVKLPARAIKAAKWTGGTQPKHTKFGYSITCWNDVPYLNNNQRAKRIVGRALNNRMRKIKSELRRASKAISEKANKAMKTGLIPTEAQMAEAIKHAADENPF